MATWYLIDPISVGVQRYLPGYLFDDSSKSGQNIIGTGVLVWPSDDPIVAAAAAKALDMQKSRGSAEIELQIVMQSAVEQSQESRPKLPFFTSGDVGKYLTANVSPKTYGLTAIQFDVPVDVGTANLMGVGPKFAYSDHQHNLPFTTVQTVLAGATGNLAFNGVRLTNIQTIPTDPAEVASKYYVDTVALGLDPKQEVIVVATSPVTLSGLANVIDSVAISSQDMRVLVTAQADPTQNGFWNSKSGAWVRTADFPTGSSATGTFTFVKQGTAYANTGWWCLSNPGVIGTNPLTFTSFTGLALVTAGDGLNKSGNLIFAVPKPDGTISIGPSGIGLGTVTASLINYSDGVSPPFTQTNVQGALDVVKARIVSTLSTAESYADAGDAATLSSAHTYSNAGDASTLASAEAYTDSLVVTAGNGLGKVVNVISATPDPDSSISVGPSGIKVGILATDAQHGNRGGGSLHANVVAAGASGFMTGADKTKLDGIATGAVTTDNTAPANIGTAAVVGVVGTAPHRDHVHALTFATVNTILSGATANIAINNRKITSLANGTASADAVAFGQLPFVFVAGTIGNSNINTQRANASHVNIGGAAGFTNFGSDTTGVVGNSAGGYSSILGGDQNRINAQYGGILGLQNVLTADCGFVAGQSNTVSITSCLGGGKSNTINGAFALFGGQSNVLGASSNCLITGTTNTVGFSCDSSIIGGSNCTLGNQSDICVIAGQSCNIGTQSEGCVALGVNSNIGNNSSYSVALGFQSAIGNNVLGGFAEGYQVTIDAGANYSRVENFGCRTSAPSSRASGIQSRSFWEGEEVFASGMWVLKGDDQARRTMLRAITTASGPGETVEAKFGVAGDQFMTLLDGHSYKFKFTWLANAGAADYAAVVQEYIFFQSGGVITQATVSNPAPTGFSVAAGHWTYTIDTASSPTRVRAQFSTGVETQTVRVTCLVEVVELTQ